jgi:hypothetical protein
MGRKSRAKQQRRSASGGAAARTADPSAALEPFDPELLEWTQRLTGLEPERVSAAAEKVRSWRLPPVEAHLLHRPSVDTAAATALLGEAVELLVEHGAEETQLLAKLRKDPYPWPAWAEIRAASILTKASDEDVRVTLEPGRAKGKQPDFRLVMPEATDGLSVEFKAIGLSDREAEFCRRVSERLPAIAPPVGLMTGHALLETPTLRMSAAELRHAHAESARLTGEVPGYPDGLSGVIVVGHGSEKNYLARLQDRLRRAIDQLPLDDESWVAFHWTNGAPVDSVLQTLDWATLPEQVAGLMFIGDAVVFPDPDIHVFVLASRRGVAHDDPRAIESTLDDDYAATLLERVESTAGVRATLLRGRVGPGRSRELLRRDGQQRILPFNLVMSGDPPEIGTREHRSWPEEEPA